MRGTTRRLPRATALACALLAAALLGGCGDDPQGTQRVSFSVDSSLEFSLLDLVVARASSPSPGAERELLAELGSTLLPEASCRASALVGNAGFFTRNGQWSAEFSDSSAFLLSGGPDSSTVELFSCTFFSDRLLEVDDFAVRVIQALDRDRAPLEILPAVSVSSIEQIGPLRTTTTEFPPGAPAYDVTASVINGSGRLGALQFDINATSIAGGWVGSAGTVNCSFNVAVGLSVCNDKGGGRLSCALVDLSGFDTSGSIVTCQFAASTQPSPDDFLVVVQDAADVRSQKVSVEMAITDLRLR